MARFRVLSLDGGGIKGTFTASILHEFERSTGKRIADHFDLITGTSTGGLIAIALGLGISAERILKFYVDRGPKIFDSNRLRRLYHAVRPKYSQRILERILRELLDGRRLGESSCRLVIPSFDCNAGRIRLFKTAHHSRFVQDHRLQAHEVAMATAAAPTYFAAFNTMDGQAYLDGGIWANCPVVVGLLEAVFVLAHSPFNLDVLSIGTTTVPHHVSGSKQRGGILTWNRELLNVQMQAQIDGALAQAQVITGKRAKRINAIVRENRFALDDASKIDDLKGLGAYHARENVDEVSERFLNERAEPFTPCLDPHATAESLADAGRDQVARRRRRKSLGVAQTGLREYRIVDISVSGALLETDREFPVNQAVQLDLILEDGTSLHAEGIVVRVQKPDWGVAAGVGVQFRDLAPETQAAIDHYVETQPPEFPTPSGGIALSAPGNPTTQ